MSDYENRLFLALIITVLLCYIIRAYRAMCFTNEVLGEALMAALAENISLRMELAKNVTPEKPSDGVSRSE